jgi:hypothetical protein
MNAKNEKKTGKRTVLRFKDGKAKVTAKFEIGRDEIIKVVHLMRVADLRLTRGTVATSLTNMLHGVDVDVLSGSASDTASVTLAEYLFPEIVEKKE